MGSNSQNKFYLHAPLQNWSFVLHKHARKKWTGSRACLKNFASFLDGVEYIQKNWTKFVSMLNSSKTKTLCKRCERARRKRTKFASMLDSLQKHFEIFVFTTRINSYLNHKIF